MKRLLSALLLASLAAPALADDTTCTLATVCSLPLNKDEYLIYPVNQEARGSNYRCLVIAGDDAVGVVIEGANGFSVVPTLIYANPRRLASQKFTGYFGEEGLGEIRLRQERTFSSTAKVVCMADG